MKTPKEIYEMFEEVKGIQVVTSGIDMKLAKLLFDLRQDDNYKQILGYEQGATWLSFLAQPELQPLTYSKARRLLEIYKTYIVQLGLEEEEIQGIDSNSLYRIRKKINKQNCIEWLDKARNLSRSDLTRELNFADTQECPPAEHQFVNKTTRKCTVCGYKETKNE